MCDFFFRYLIHCFLWSVIQFGAMPIFLHSISVILKVWVQVINWLLRAENVYHPSFSGLQRLISVLAIKQLHVLTGTSTGCACNWADWKEWLHLCCVRAFDLNLYGSNCTFNWPYWSRWHIDMPMFWPFSPWFTTGLVMFLGLKGHFGSVNVGHSRALNQVPKYPVAIEINTTMPNSKGFAAFYLLMCEGSWFNGLLVHKQEKYYPPFSSTMMSQGRLLVSCLGRISLLLPLCMTTNILPSFASRLIKLPEVTWKNKLLNCCETDNFFV